VTLIAGSKRRSLLTAGDDDEMFMTRSLNVSLLQRQQNRILIARSDKSVVYVTNNKTARRFVLLKLQTRSTRGLFATAELLVASRLVHFASQVSVPRRTPPDVIQSSTSAINQAVSTSC